MPLRIPVSVIAVVLAGCAAMPFSDVFPSSVLCAKESKVPDGLPGFDDAIAVIPPATFRASPGLIPIRRWRPRTKGSVRLVGYIQNLSAKTEAEFRVLVDGKKIFSRHLGRTDSIRHGVDILALDLAKHSTVDFLVIGGADSRRAQVAAAFQIVREPHCSRWRADLPTGFPKLTDAQRQTQRKSAQRVLRQIRDASQSGRRRVVVPPGDYLFNANRSRESTLKGLADLEIVAHGATFWFESPQIHALLFHNCRNVTVRGLDIDFTTPPWFQAHITSIDRKNNTLRAALMDGYTPRDADGKEENSGRRKFIFYDAAGGFINHQHIRGEWRRSQDRAGVLCRPNRIPDALRAGDYLVSTIQTGAALRSINCSAMRFEDVNVWSSPGQAVYEGGGEGGNVYLRLRATRRPHTNRLHAFGADVFHLSASDRGPKLDRCESAYGADDNINIHGRFGRVVKRVNDRLYYMQGEYEAGDSIEFRDPSSLTLLGTAKVVAAKKTPDGPSLEINTRYRAKGEFLVELDRALQLPDLSLVVMDGKRSCGNFVIRNCWFHSNFQRTLINGAPGGLIENTTLQNVGHGLCVQFETWGPWMEGPFARDLVIRNNRFLDSPPAGPAISVSMHPPGGGSNRRRMKARPVTNLEISGNYFARTGGIPVSIHNVHGLQVQGNSIDRPPQPPRPDQSDWLYLQDCGKVSVRNNQKTGR